ncbi:MAG: response regulator [Chloroflexota bacterium]|nr:response regulator [Chloroflexota bacterium]
MATLLVVDDNAVNLRMMGYTLQKNGHTIVTAMHGGEALERLAETPIDLVLTDLTMPEMDGMTLLKHIRTDERFQHLPVIMLTASGQDEDRHTARAAGASEFLTKPTSSRDLVDTVNRLLS